MTVCSPDAVIIGGGLAGASSAYALARRGLKVLLCEGESALAQRASGNRLGLIMPYISDYSSPLERVYSTGFRFTIEMLRSVFSEEGLLNQVGGIQLPTTTRLKKLIHDRTAIIGSTEIQRISALEGSELSGITISHPSLYAPESGYVSPVRMVEALLQWCAQTGELRMNTQVIDLKRDHTGWCCYLASGDTVSTPNVIVCGAYESSALTPLSWLPLEPVRGQTVSVKSSPTSRALRTIICFDGYLTPEHAGAHLLGAQYRHNDLRLTPSEEDSSEMLLRCQRWLPELQFTPTSIESPRVCFRTSTTDRLPYIGAVPDLPAIQRESSYLQPGLFVNVGHGSRGLLSCPFAGELIARLITEEALGDLTEVAKLCAPERLISRFQAASV